MANEILVLRETPEPGGLESYSLMFVFRINPVISVNGAVYAPTKSDTMPQEVTEFGLLSGPELAVFDSGDYMFVVRVFKRHRGITRAEMLQQIKDAWTAQNEKIVPELRTAFSKTGIRISV